MHHDSHGHTRAEPRPGLTLPTHLCILCFHARAGYLQHYETLLKEVQLHPAPEADQQEPVDQYDVELCTLADSNHNVPCESGIRYPSLVAMQNRPLMTSHISDVVA
jgi:hypothetical protein